MSCLTVIKYSVHNPEHLLYARCNLLRWMQNAFCRRICAFGTLFRPNHPKLSNLNGKMHKKGEKKLSKLKE